MSRSRPAPEEAETLGQILINLSWKKPPQTEDIRDLIQQGANLDARDDMDRCALSLAIGAGNEDIARLLLEAGANPDMRDGLQRTPLIWAVTFSTPAIVSLLLEHGAKPDAQDRDGYTALMNASISGKLEIARMLLRRGANTDLQSTYGHSALSLACLNLGREPGDDRTALVRLLADAGADATLKNDEGKTCLDFLKERGRDALVSYIESAPARREAARPKLVVPKPEKSLKLKIKPRGP